MGVEDIEPQQDRRHLRGPEGLERADFRPGYDRHRHPQRLRNGYRHFQGRSSIRNKDLPRISRLGAQQFGLHNKPKIAMYCTGGIRCEKATAFMKEQGFDEVFHLKGGILKYLEEVPEAESLWKAHASSSTTGFSVTHGLKEGNHRLCHACREPLTAEDRASPLFEDGVSCPHCHGTRSEADRERYRQRQRQIALAHKRGEKHLGS